jgi:anti-sigma regulatory factor (Ser/Thr protein kinase)
MTDDGAPGTWDDPRSAPNRLRLRHRAAATELGSIRGRVDRWARQHAVPEDTVIDLQLALGEAVSNGVEHAYRDDDAGTVEVELEIRRIGRLRVVAVRVVDHGRWRPTPAHPGYRGRGLTLIERLSRDLQVSRTRYGTQVCFDIPVGS